MLYSMSFPLSHNDKNKYRYSHHNGDSTCKGIDVHEIFMTKSRVRLLLSHIGILVCLVNCYISLVKLTFWYLAILISGKIARRFVPGGKILRPVLNECVTPFTCYWSLALILHGEDQLMLVFQELKPPLKLLVPIWKALRSSFDVKEGSSA
ncbi:hypothetical protein MA16_Dca017653 [Dendrobium catenatum]|uniref:Phosphatidylinositol N-acetylglucosaminyltransferase subunit H conserved domain-containing protein n=1 Tax=Dendrobium catenatum TaxID=906689 RepID=A0A2I0VMS2_9ASPA|nr:hypothetical protein MA16_Dca017653 [Dendrobium catenatum]